MNKNINWTKILAAKNAIQFFSNASRSHVFYSSALTAAFIGLSITLGAKETKRARLSFHFSCVEKHLEYFPAKNLCWKVVLQL